MGRAMVFRDPNLWATACQQAARELNMPPRGEKGSAANIQRRNMMPKIQKRAREIYYERTTIPPRAGVRGDLKGDNRERVEWVVRNIAPGKKKRS